MVTDMCDPEIIKNMHMKHAYTFEGKDAKIAVIPDGLGVIVI
ncbi:hypothetical protein [Clostridium niameyense]